MYSISYIMALLGFNMLQGHGKCGERGFPGLIFYFGGKSKARLCERRLRSVRHGAQLEPVTTQMITAVTLRLQYVYLSTFIMMRP
jgi:hypothetical protein